MSVFDVAPCRLARESRSTSRSADWPYALEVVQSDTKTSAARWSRVVALRVLMLLPRDLLASALEPATALHDHCLIAPNCAGVFGEKPGGHIGGPVRTNACNVGKSSDRLGRADGSRERQLRRTPLSCSGMLPRRWRTGTGDFLSWENGFLFVPSGNGSSPVNS